MKLIEVKAIVEKKAPQQGALITFVPSEQALLAIPKQPVS